MVTLASDGALTKGSEGGTMKKALAAAICGGVLMFFVPQVASGNETTGGGNDGGCAKLKAGAAKIETRCLNGKHDKVCGNESACYPPLTKGVKAQAVYAIEHSYKGKGIAETWKEHGRRSPARVSSCAPGSTTPCTRSCSRPSRASMTCSCGAGPGGGSACRRICSDRCP